MIKFESILVVSNVVLYSNFKHVAHISDILVMFLKARRKDKWGILVLGMMYQMKCTEPIVKAFQHPIFVWKT